MIEVSEQRPRLCSDPLQLADTLIERLDGRIVLALPLGLGKANHVANALYHRVAADSTLSLTIFTALTFEKPKPGSELGRRFLEPLSARFFDGYPELAYAQALRDGNLPAHIVVHEFFLTPGRWLNNPLAQQQYLSANYTHVFDLLLRAGVNLLAQLIAPAEGGEGTEDRYSLSCNPDVTADLFKARARQQIEFLAVGQVNRALPYMRGEAECRGSDFDYLLEGEAVQFPLFRPPQEPVELVDHAIGLQVASRIPDGGTLQIGIGSIGDAICHALLLRHRQPALFRELLGALGIDCEDSACLTSPFEEGLYAASEMVIEGFLHLIEGGVLKREVDGVVLHGAFFLGSPRFYRMLDEMPTKLRDKIAMMPVSFVNQLYDQESRKRQQRRDARFINSAILATLSGAVISDGLEYGQVISGVGGQYNFVAMAFALDDARSIITLPATRTKRGKTETNIRASYGHVTIPRHLRDIVVTEYGIAELRGKTDAGVIAEMLGITDSRFQESLLAQARAAGKIATDYRLPARQCNNTGRRVREALGPAQRAGQLPRFPLGSDYTEVEERLVPVLKRLSTLAGAKPDLAGLVLKGSWPRRVNASQRACLERMGLARPGSLREWFYRALLLGALRE